MFGIAKTICDAIESRNVIEFTYKGSRRRVEPYLLGDDQKGHLTLSAFQLSGGSAVDWRDFHVDTLGGLTVTALRFDGKRPGYNRNDPTMRSIRCRV
jgi:hypothetical protein